MKLKGATAVDIALSIALPIIGLLAGLIALIKREYKRSVMMLALSVGMLAILAVPVVFLSMEGGDALRNPFLGFRLAIAADWVNLSAPRAIDKFTRLDGATLGPGLVLTYRYTLLNFDARRLGTGVFAARLKPLLTQKICASEDSGGLLQQNVVLRFSYRQKDGTPVALIAVDRRVCDTQ